MNGNIQTRSDRLKPLLDEIEKEEWGEAPSPDETHLDQVAQAFAKWKIPMGATQASAYADDEALYILLDGERGSGKCASVDSLLYLSDRLMLLGDANPGVHSGFHPLSIGVWGWDGSSLKPTDSSEFYKESDRTAIRLSLSHGAEFTGSPRHPIWCCASDGSAKPTFGFVSLSEIERRKNIGHRFWTPLFKHPGITRGGFENVCGLDVTEDVAYAIGALCGDGSCSKIVQLNARSLTLTNNDEEVIRRVKKGLNEIGCDIWKEKASKYGYYIYGSNIKMLIHAGKIDCLSYHKRIPWYIIKSRQSVLCSFLRGLFDTDGTVDKHGSVSLCTTSERLGRETQDILIALGILCVRRPKKSASGNPTWTISVFGRHASTFSRVVGFEIKRKLDRIVLDKEWNPNRYLYPDPIKAEIRRIFETERRPRIKTRHARIAPKMSGKRVITWTIRQAFKFIPSKEKLDAFVDMFGSSDELDAYRVSDTWVEVDGASYCDADLCDLSVPETRSFLCSGLINHNTVGALHKLVKHCYNERNALGLILVEVTSMAEEGGAWHKLIHDILPQWNQAIGLEASEPKLHPTSRKPFVWIENKYGSGSRVICMSMPVDSYVADRVKGMEPSFVLVDEAQTLRSPTYFTSVVQQLGRRKGIEGKQQIVYCCNPDGPSHWLYKRFFQIPVDEETGEWNKDYARYHIPISENIRNLPPGYYDRVLEAVRGDPIEEARMVRGEWIDRPAGRAIFADIYSDILHVRGDAAKNIGIVPVKGIPVVVGYDLGPAHSSIHFLQRLPTDEKAVWIVFDELNYVSTYTPYRLIVPKLLERMAYWDKAVEGKRPFVYTHFADSSAFNQVRGDGSFDVMVFEQESAKLGRGIHMKPAPKGPGSVKERIRMAMDMLEHGELLVSATCVKTRTALRMLESKGQRRGEYDPDAGLTPIKSPHLHVFDSMTYAIISVRSGNSRGYLIEENDARITHFG